MKRLVILCILLSSLAACGSQPVGCSSESARSTVIGLLKGQLEKQATQDLRREDGQAVSLSKIRAAISQVVFSLDDIRTSKEDPNSTKRFCAATLKLKFPTATLEDADKARDASGLNSVSDLAEVRDVERAADTFSTTMEFNIQPTDDGGKVFAETESGANILHFASETLASALLRTTVEDTRRAESEAQAQQEAAANAALADQRSANIDAAKAENQLATQTINATWRAIPNALRSRLLPLQRAWVKKREADCRVEAASTSLEPSEIEAARLSCDTRATQERVRWLDQYRVEDPAITDNISEDGAAM